MISSKRRVGILITSISFFLLLISLPLLRERGNNPIDFFAESLKCEKNMAHSSTPDPNDCLYSAAEHGLAKFSAKELLSSIENATDEEKLSCHNFAHAIGQVLYSKNTDISNILKQCPDDCFEGCPHSIMEHYISDRYASTGITGQIINPELENKFSNICSDIKTMSFYNCYVVFEHALGHSLMSITDSNIGLSLRLCDALSNNYGNDKSPCYTGAFMVQSGLPGQEKVSEDMLEVCESVPIKYRFICFNDRLKSVIGPNLATNIITCSNFYPKYRDECYARVNKSQTVISEDFKAFKNACYMITEKKYELDCIADTAYEMASRFINDIDKAFRFCSILGDDEVFCREKVSDRVNEINNAHEKSG